MRIKIIKSTRNYKAGDTVEVSNNVGFGLVDSGIGVVSKDLTPDDYKQAGVKDGSITKLRPNN